MLKRISLILAALFLIAAVAPSFAQTTEDEAVAQFLKKLDKKKTEHNRVAFVTFGFAYGKLPNDNPYNQFYTYANANIDPLDGSRYPVLGIWRSKQFELNAGMMISPRVTFSAGFDYWLKMGSNKTGDYEFDIAPLGTQYDFNIKSEVQVYGFKGGFDYYLLNPPDNKGIFNSFAIRVGGGAGFYFAKWDIWDGSTAFNLATGTSDLNAEPLKGSAPGFYGSIGLDYPIGFLGLLVGADFNYLFLNFTKVKGYNNIGEELYVTYSDNTNDRVELDFSGLRGRLLLKRFFQL